ncbi:2-oxoglutarate and iron-dependent oxygenase domain-containing protein [Iamia majanohamensis]|uniref:2-oxoglutarate and iron-dependent oxygenase domain-containing protein n=1 Tax=Iamia majanohamensis TaxID=467976 RepID=A0AAF0BXI8_9ACTN|nr:2-oxoglutarate and iron-dependent oxygenase domain-containing protein [Iamia majanohamensis]WCO68799.1 2-oxoglutarate and iron-dependent oxygenase domain-containing protein [Iamia majanohamensis]
MIEIPVVSLAGPDAEVAAAVGAACTGAGFLVVVDHGIPAEVVRRAFAEAERFFALPRERKAALADTGIEDRGWFPMGGQSLETGTPPDLSEFVMVGRDLGPDHPEVRAGTPMYGPNPWPDDLPGWREAVEAYHSAADDLCRRLLGYLALSLGLPADHLAPFAGDPVSTLKLAHYVPRPDQVAEGQLGAGAHTDWGAISVVAQDGVGGLEVLVDEEAGTWIEAPVVEGSLVVNLGDMVPRWTNDRYVSRTHRVRNPVGRDRYSLVLFFDLDYHARIEVLETCTGPDDPPRYAPVLAGEWLLSRYRESIGAS